MIPPPVYDWRHGFGYRASMFDRATGELVRCVFFYDAQTHRVGRYHTDPAGQMYADPLTGRAEEVWEIRPLKIAWMDGPPPGVYQDAAGSIPATADGDPAALFVGPDLARWKGGPAHNPPRRRGDAVRMDGGQFLGTPSTGVIHPPIVPGEFAATDSDDVRPDIVTG